MSLSIGGDRRFIEELINNECALKMSLRDVVRYVVSKLHNGSETLRGYDLKDRKYFIGQCIFCQQSRQIIGTGTVSSMLDYLESEKRANYGRPTLSPEDFAVIMRVYQKNTPFIAFRLGISKGHVKRIRKEGLYNTVLLPKFLKVVAEEDREIPEIQYALPEPSGRNECYYCSYPLKGEHERHLRYQKNIFCSEQCCRLYCDW